MRINVPPWAYEHFWQDPAPGHSEFWAFRFEPRCQIGDLLEFYFKGKKVAEATVALVQAPGAGKGGFRDRWKVFWRPETFKDLREKDLTNGKEQSAENRGNHDNQEL